MADLQSPNETLSYLASLYYLCGMKAIRDRLRHRLDRLAATDNRRQLPGEGRGVDFWSNDYLGIARDLPSVSAPAGGATGSRLISGDHGNYREIESFIADFHGAPAALVFNSGYAANLGLLSAVVQRGDTVLYDQLIHASLRDGIRLGYGRAHSFRHNDLNHLEDRLKRANGPVFVVTEGIFSMDGDAAPLEAMVELCEDYGAALIVDEAHSAGLYGEKGSGLVPALGLNDGVFARVITYGKAFGVHGAAVLGSQNLVDYLVNHARSFIFSTGPSPHQWASIKLSYDLLMAEGEERRAKLNKLIERWGQKAPLFEEKAALPVKSLYMPLHPIQIFPCPGNATVLAREQALKDAGFLVKAIRHPTVAAGAERLRICLHAFNEAAEIDQLAAILSHAD